MAEYVAFNHSIRVRFSGILPVYTTREKIMKRFRVIKVNDKFFAQVREYRLFVPIWKTINPYCDFAYSFDSLGITDSNACETKTQAEARIQKWVDTHFTSAKKTVVNTYTVEEIKKGQSV